MLSRRMQAIVHMLTRSLMARTGGPRQGIEQYYQAEAEGEGGQVGGAVA